MCVSCQVRSGLVRSRENACSFLLGRGWLLLAARSAVRIGVFSVRFGSFHICQQQQRQQWQHSPPPPPCSHALLYIYTSVYDMFCSKLFRAAVIT